MTTFNADQYDRLVSFSLFIRSIKFHIDVARNGFVWLFCGFQVGHMFLAPIVAENVLLKVLQFIFRPIVLEVYFRKLLHRFLPLFN